MFRKILQSWLESWGYQVTVAEDGAQAWQNLQQVMPTPPTDPRLDHAQLERG